MMSPIRVLVVEDSSFMRKALARRIDMDSRFQVVDTATDGKDGVEKALRLRPDVVTLDVDMPVMNGIEALKQIVARSTIPVVMLSAVTEAGARITLEALEIGAVDFIPKSNGAEHLHEKLAAAVSASQAKRRGFRGDTPTAKAAASTLAPKPDKSVRIAPKIMVIGSSTGGPQALTRVVTDLPAGFPIPVVVAQHMPPKFTLALAKRLNECSKVAVVEAADGDILRPGVVYIAPGGSHLRVKGKQLEVAADKGESLYHPSVDVLAQSVSAHYGRNVLGIMLTGMGNDGAREFTKLRQLGAYNIAQDQATSAVFGMPKSLIDSGGANEVVPLDGIVERIKSLMGL